MNNQAKHLSYLCRNFKCSGCYSYAEDDNTRYLTGAKSSKLAFKKHVTKLFKQKLYHNLEICSSILTYELILLFHENRIDLLTIDSCNIHEADKDEIIKILTKIDILKFFFISRYDTQNKNDTIYDICLSRFFIKNYHTSISFYSHPLKLPKLSKFFLYSKLKHLRIHTLSKLSSKLEKIIMKNQSIQKLNSCFLRMNNKISQEEFLTSTIVVKENKLVKMLFPSLCYRTQEESETIEFSFRLISKEKNDKSVFRSINSLICAIVERQECEIKGMNNDERMFFKREEKVKKNYKALFEFSDSDCS